MFLKQAYSCVKFKFWGEPVFLNQHGSDRVTLVFQSEGEGSLVRIFVGRIGVSLMLRYHKTHQWLKVTHRRLLSSTTDCSLTVLRSPAGPRRGGDPVPLEGRLHHHEGSVRERGLRVTLQAGHRGDRAFPAERQRGGGPKHAPG